MQESEPTSEPEPEPTPEEETQAGGGAAAPAPAPEPKQEITYYDNCTAARAAGAAPLYRGEPGYRPGLDRDKDGIACEIK
nr:excalibur calcium-binding domain-containing protein [Actinomyces oris]